MILICLINNLCFKFKSIIHYATTKNIKSKQMFISTGLTINYSYNNIKVSFIPIGFDFGTTSLGKKWVYNKRRWWGFGIGLEPKFFSALMNK